MSESEVASRWMNSTCATAKIKENFRHRSVWMHPKHTVFGCFVVQKCLVYFKDICIALGKNAKKKNEYRNYSKFTQDSVSFNLNGFSKSKVNNKTKFSTTLHSTWVNRRCIAVALLIDITKHSTSIHTFSETDVFCSSFAALSTLGRVSRPIEAVT